MSAVRKKATRSQKKIHRENQETIRNYFLASLFGCISFLLFHTLLAECCGWKAWTGFVISIVLEASTLAIMSNSTRCLKGEKGKVLDAGVDLNGGHSFGECCKDIIILCVITQLLASISPYFKLNIL